MRPGKTQMTRHSMRAEASDHREHVLIKGAGAILQNDGKTLIREGVGKKRGHCHDEGQEQSPELGKLREQARRRKGENLAVQELVYCLKFPH